MKRNLVALYLIKLSKWFSLVMPIIVLFYQEHKLDLQDIFILKSIFSIVAVTIEIPSGYLADTWGRRNCLILGCLLFFAGYLCYSFTGTFAAFVVAEIFLGMGQTLVNGADSALLYDTTEYYKHEDRYLHYEGKITMIGNFAEAAAGIIGGFFAIYSLRYPFYGQVFIAFIGIPAAISLKEIPLIRSSRSRFSEILKIIKFSLFENKQLSYNIMFSGIIGAATLTMAWLVQPVLIKINMPTGYFGITWTVLNLTVGLSALFSDRLEHALGMKKTYTLILVFIVGSYVALAFNLSFAGLSILLVFYVMRGFATPILKGYVNRIAFSNMRATVLSIRNFVVRIIFAAMAPFVGWVSDSYSLQVALLMSSVVILIPGLVFLVLQLRK